MLGATKKEKEIKTLRHVTEWRNQSMILKLSSTTKMNPKKILRPSGKYAFWSMGATDGHLTWVCASVGNWLGEKLPFLSCDFASNHGCLFGSKKICCCHMTVSTSL